MLQILADGHAWRTMEKWQSEKKWGHALGTAVGTGLRDGVGKRVGILGYGSIGRQSRSLLSLFIFFIFLHFKRNREISKKIADTFRCPRS